MKVRDLIDILQSYDLDLTVMSEADGGTPYSLAYSGDICDVRIQKYGEKTYVILSTIENPPEE